MGIGSLAVGNFSVSKGRAPYVLRSFYCKHYSLTRYSHLSSAIERVILLRGKLTLNEVFAGTRYGHLRLKQDALPHYKLSEDHFVLPPAQPDFHKYHSSPLGTRDRK